MLKVINIENKLVGKIACNRQTILVDLIFEYWQFKLCYKLMKELLGHKDKKIKEVYTHQLKNNVFISESILFVF